MDGDQFLRFDSGPGPQRVMVFMHAEARIVLNTGQVVDVGMDGQFQTAGHPFAQVSYTLSI